MNEYDLVGADEEDEILALLGVGGDDLVGDDDDDDYVGDDDDDDDDDVSGEDLVGARRRRRRRRPKLDVRALRARARTIRRTRQLQKSRKMTALARARNIPQIPMGVPATAIATLLTLPVICTPTVAVRITDFFVDASVAAQCAIVSMTMGRINLLANANPVPCSGFDPTAGAQRSPLEVGIVPAGSPITILVNNFSLVNLTFRAWFQVIDLSTHPAYG